MKRRIAQVRDFQIIYVDTHLKEMGRTSPVIQCGPHTVTSFQGVQPGKGVWRVIWLERNLTKAASARWSRSKSTACACILDPMCWEPHFVSVVFLPETHSPGFTAWEKCQTDHNWGIFHKMRGQHFSRLLRLSKPREVWETMAVERKAVSWMGLRNRKGTLGKN